MKQLSVILVEDDPAICREIESYVDGLEDTDLLGVFHDSDKAEQAIRELLPDAIILDLELHRGGGSGITLMQALQQNAPKRMPYILVTTNNTSQLTYEAVRRSGADYIFSKHQQGYRSEDAVDFLRSLKHVLSEPREARAPAAAEPVSAPKEDKTLTRRISRELELVGISPKAVGYQYLMDCIRIVIDGPQQNLCAIIGKKYGKTDSSVERAMQNAIAKAWRTTPIDELLAHYRARISSEKGVPTMTEFIYYYANKLRNE